MTETEKNIHRIVNDERFLSDRPFGGGSVTGTYYADPASGSGSVQICLCESDVSLVLADCSMKDEISLHPNREGELYITCFHHVSAGRRVRGKHVPLLTDYVYISDTGSGIDETVFDADSRLCGFVLIVDTEKYARHLSRILHTDSLPLLTSLPSLDQAVHEPAIGTIFRSLFHFRGDDVSSRLFYRGKAAEIISVLLSHHPRHQADSGKHCESVHQYQQHAEIEKIVRYMSAHLSESLTAEELARLFSSSPSRLSSMFKKVTDRTLPEYRNLLRVEEARRLLTETNLTQEEIARQVGFSRVSNFSDFYRRMTGEAPGALRKNRGAS